MKILIKPRMHVVLTSSDSLESMPEFSETTTRVIAVVFWASATVLVYAHVVYPALMAALSLLASRKGDARSIAELPSVTLVIPAYNEEAVLEAKLRNALAIDYPRDRLDIVVASDGSADRPIDIAGTETANLAGAGAGGCRR